MSVARALLLGVALLAGPIATVGAEQVRILPAPGPGGGLQFQLRISTLPTDIQPGREAAVRPAPPVAYQLQWDEYRSLIAVGEGTGLYRPAWVVTFDAAGGVAVAYRGRAFVDARGAVHIDARDAVCIGMQAVGWSPDNFALMPDGPVTTLDERDQSNTGRVTDTIDAAGRRAEYDRLLRLAQALVDGAA